MTESTEVTITIIAVTLMILLICGAVIFLLLLNNSRRIRHGAELTEMRAQHEREVIQAELEAVQHTLRDLGEELHDNVGQLLTVVQMGLNTTLAERPDLRLSASRDALDQAVEEVRRLGHNLNSELWRQRSLVDAISLEAERLERVGRIHAFVEKHGPFPSFSPDHCTILFRVFQEVVNNALKHSGADVIHIIIDGRGGPLLTITDNGVGFDTGNTTGNGGLGNIRRRCTLIGYSATCTSAPGQGCSWRIEQLKEHGT